MPSDRELQFAILALVRENGRSHKIRVIGRATQPGELELRLKIVLDGLTRARADYAWEQLRRKQMIMSDYSSTSDPELWVEVTDAGVRAIERHALDDLDEALAKVRPDLVQTRDAAWMALDGAGGPAVSQAANSICELIDHFLRAGEPDANLRGAGWFRPDPGSKTGITRRHRAQWIMEQRHGRFDQDRCAALVAAHDSAEGIKHAPHGKSHEDVLHAIQYAEECLRELLFWPSRAESTPDERSQ
jgi:hypothetical protein